MDGFGTTAWCICPETAARTWSNVTPGDLPEWAQVNSIDAHPFEPGGLYVAATRYKSDDFRPYLYRTTDWGESWTRIVDGIPEDHFTRVIRADPETPGLLYAGTERGAHVSFDDGASWQSLQLELPIVPITDLAVAEGNLAAADAGPRLLDARRSGAAAAGGAGECGDVAPLPAEPGLAGRRR